MAQWTKEQEEEAATKFGHHFGAWLLDFFQKNPEFHGDRFDYEQVADHANDIVYDSVRLVCPHPLSREAVNKACDAAHDAVVMLSPEED